MDILRLPFLLFLTVVAFAINLQAQSTPLFESESAYANPSNADNKVTSIPTPYRFHKRLQKLYSGYAIEVAASNYPLDRDNPVFRQFGNIHYDKLLEGGYSYLILANFGSNESALHFLRTVIQPKANEARLFSFKDGIRKAIR